MSNDEFALYDAAYVMGALSPTERREFENHLRGCAACATAVAELAGLPGLMSRVSVTDLMAEAERPPETLLPSLARAVRRERLRRRLVVGTSSAAAACLIAVAAVAVAGPGSPERPPARPSATSSATTGAANQAFTAVVPSPVTASARLIDVAWGTRIDLTCNYVPDADSPASGRPYALVVIDRFGSAQQVATWNALPGRELHVMGASSATRADISAMEIRTPSGRAILRLSI